MLSNKKLTYIIDNNLIKQRKQMFLRSMTTVKHEQPGYQSPAARSCFIGNWDATRGT